MNTKHGIRVFFVGLSLLLASAAQAQWELDSAKSSVNFFTVKNASMGETHSFSSLMGFIGAQGSVQLSINLDSVETLIPIRNERLRSVLFETSKFPTATVAANVDPAIMTEVNKGGTVSTELPVKLSLHGLEQNLVIPVLVFSDGSSLRVVTPRPVVLSAADFGLDVGVEALREVAGLNTISTAVPVTFSLQFQHVE